MGTIATIIVYIITIANSAAIVYLFTRHSQVMNHVERKIHEVHMHNRVASAFDTKDTKGMNKIAQDLSQRLRMKYQFEAKTFTDLVEEVKRSQKLDEQFRAAIIDFFEKITIFSYKEESMSEQDLMQLKNEFRLISSRIVGEQK